MEGKYLNERQAAQYVGLSIKTLQRLRVNGNGLPFIKAGARILYDRNDLDEYMQNRKIQSTSAHQACR